MPGARPMQQGAGVNGKDSGQGKQRLAEVARGGSLNMIGAAVAGAATLGVTVLVTTRFSKPVAGAFFTATSAFLLVETVAALGASTGLVYFIARLRSLGAGGRVAGLVRAAVIPVAIASLVGMALLWGLSGPLSHILLSGHQAHGKVTPAGVAAALRALAFTMPFAALLDTLLGATRGYRDMRPTVMVDRIGRQLGQLAGVLLAAALGSAALLAPLWAVSYLPAVVIAWLWLRRIRRTRPLNAVPVPAPLPAGLALLMSLSRPLPGGAPVNGRRAQPVSGRTLERLLANATPGGFWRFTTPRALANLAAMILQRLDIVLVAIMKGPAWAAVYTAATRFLVAGQLGSMAISRAAQPRFTELFTIGDRRGANLVYQVTTAWLVVLTWPLYLLTVVDGPQALAIFGHSYRAGGTVMVILGLSMLLSTACGQVDMVLITSGRSSWSLINGLMQVGVNVGLDLWLIPRYGITGAAIGWAAAISVGNLVPLAQLAVAVRLHPFGRGAFAAVGVTTVSFCVLPLAVRAVFGHGAGPTLAGLAGGCVLLVAGLWWFREALWLSSLPGASGLIRRMRRLTARTARA